ncbi:DEHA2G09878p [Debaryomyces hansenii CBS767]|uniref:Small ribosomal subunit protein uS9m n=1 Tax=Debaryomyces hansenii (strain ATCC 36239 / CBS 767 / BCRC 21394 / JCM 1990 / NBRC 0083 / IGC 2968) TaxID=284592 RepID=RT09_DEBHA|nr:mitochondrial 37S ribosomal protein MRPS9 [Debaryomyces hansenii CBS767]Q6BIJ5.2 RecName: Full=Small ribosomal subunit protein uS9m; AltName: Full=37S ribosomal protein S9, mitochondrial; Flags: Precursor [Debaryomyces hansenii CBS767]CAG90446.2 DEHA2G09878p [Debaryomyces hansenii CBS767]|eukprot:XP_461976.2 mitochondrial 37S ribosomal protein MRPS9 [Debaryomyces hansenii CBS767]
MSVRSLYGISGLRISTRTFSKTAFRLQEQVNQTQESTDTEINGRPLVPANLKNAKGERLMIPSKLQENALRNYELERLRIIPKLNTFYGGNPVHEENLNTLNGLIRKYINLPTRIVDDKEIQNTKFVSFEEYKTRIQSGTRLKPIHHKELTQLLHRLRSIDPELMPREVSDVLAKFANTSSESAKAAQKVKTLDEFGRAISLGKRKRSVAKVYLTKGDGQVMVNGKSLLEYFPKEADRRRIAYPFQVVSQEGQYNVFAEVQSGGSTGQAEAVMYGIAKDLVIFNPLLKSRLHKSGLMTRDARKVERKKPGKVKARKSPTWVKR